MSPLIRYIFTEKLTEVQHGSMTGYAYRCNIRDLSHLVSS